MNREIKFRAWDKVRNIMLTPNVSEAGFVSVNDWFASSQEPITPWVLMQFTNVKDRNGIKIYEGDILKYIGIDVYGVEYYKYKIVEYNIKEAGYSPLCADAPDDRANQWFPDEIEVIGNIYENQELLTQIK